MIAFLTWLLQTDIQPTVNEVSLAFPLPSGARNVTTRVVVHLANDFGIAQLQVELRVMHVLLVGASGAGKTSLFRVLLEDEGFQPDFAVSHVMPDRSRVRHLAKGFLKFTDRRGVETYAVWMWPC